MPRPWKRPALPASPLGELNRALHELHHRAGWPSSRQIQRALGKQSVFMSHTKIHSALTNPMLPTKGAVEMITRFLAESIRDADVDTEIDRLLGLWDKASLDGQSSAARAFEGSTAETPALVEPPALSKEQIEAEQQLRERAKNGDTEAMVQLGNVAERRASYQEALGWYQIAAHADQPDAMYYLGSLLGDFVPREKAMYWFYRAAQIGQPNAMCYIGLLLEKEGRSHGALDWYRRAAALGECDAMYYLGSLLCKMGAWEEGEPWLRHLAQRGDVEAMVDLSKSLRARGDHTEADMWDRQRKK